MAYKEMYEKVGSVVGWDFSKIDKRKKVVGKKWDFLEIVKGYVTDKTVLLDIGTGGGKKLLEVAKTVEKAYGIDHQQSMISTAHRNLAESKMRNVEFKLADAKNLPFPEEHFDIIMCRHAPFSAQQVYRVMKPKGIFLTQQVYSGKDAANIKRIFGRGQGYGRKPGTGIKKHVRELQAAGFEILRKDTCNVTEYYADMADVIFLLRNTPIIPDFDIDKDRKHLEEIESKYKTDYGIKTNSARYLLVCRKPSREIVRRVDE